MVFVVCFFFFFFQAEDGIRDRDVTGVQTCALPISLERALLARERLVETLAQTARAAHAARRRRAAADSARAAGAGGLRGLAARTRSEERRVGKEGRCRWAPEH